MGNNRIRRKGDTTIEVKITFLDFGNTVDFVSHLCEYENIIFI